MAFEKISSTVVADGSLLEITPSVEVQKDSIYTITITGLKSVDGKEFPKQTIRVATAASNMYCSLTELKNLCSTFNIPDEVMLSFIRAGSNYADFIASTISSTSSSGTTTLLYSKGMLAQVWAALECLTVGFLQGGFVVGGNRYKLGEDELEEGDRAASFKNLLDWLRWLLKYWIDAVRGYWNEGRARPRATRQGISASDNQDVAQITVDSLITDFTRNAVQFS